MHIFKELNHARGQWCTSLQSLSSYEWCRAQEYYFHGESTVCKRFNGIGLCDP